MFVPVSIQSTKYLNECSQLQSLPVWNCSCAQERMSHSWQITICYVMLSYYVGHSQSRYSERVGAPCWVIWASAHLWVRSLTPLSVDSGNYTMYIYISSRLQPMGWEQIQTGGRAVGYSGRFCSRVDRVTERSVGKSTLLHLLKRPPENMSVLLKTCPPRLTSENR